MNNEFNSYSFEILLVLTNSRHKTLPFTEMIHYMPSIAKICHVIEAKEASGIPVEEAGTNRQNKI